MPPKSKPAAAAAGLVPGTLNQTQLDIKNRPHLAAKFRRMADLRVNYSGVTKALMPALEELAARTAQNLRDDDHYTPQRPQPPALRPAQSPMGRQFAGGNSPHQRNNDHEDGKRSSQDGLCPAGSGGCIRGKLPEFAKLKGVPADRMVDIELE
ncbi:hypothetical protein OEA41_008812 [Lepraria neglecta]|uniref:Uncharacterized protein n=1 Tax=Lepraria neglecta TaxID=209136 RepID=A0AAD9Z0R7_9LECA|nr:hypothetical protein OEA41_008812 [Lepraria neglecta]